MRSMLRQCHQDGEVLVRTSEPPEMVEAMALTGSTRDGCRTDGDNCDLSYRCQASVCAKGDRGS